MPIVNGKHYSYDKKGKAAAKKEAKKKGVKMQYNEESIMNYYIHLGILLAEAHQTQAQAHNGGEKSKPPTPRTRKQTDILKHEPTTTQKLEKYKRDKLKKQATKGTTTNKAWKE